MSSCDLWKKKWKSIFDHSSTLNTSISYFINVFWIEKLRDNNNNNNNK